MTEIPTQRILVADDAPDVRLMLARFLQGTSFVPEFVTDGAQAVAAAQVEAFTVIIMDLQMPVLDGMAATQAIRDWEQGAGRAPAPIIALTGDDDAETIAACLAAGYTAHLAKPIRKALLLETLEHYTMTRHSAPAGSSAVPACCELVPVELQDLIPGYLANRQADLANLRVALTAGDLDTIHLLGHRMKGSGGGYGLTGISSLGAALEKSARTGDHASIASLIESLARYLTDVTITYEH
jgi:CheY-like chemotaxis protein